MANTLWQLEEKIRLYNCWFPTPGSTVNAKVTDALVAGITSYTYVNTDESDGVEKSSELEELVAEDFDSL